MNAKNFAIGRTDGRSNSQVIIDLVKENGAPDTIFSYEELKAVLNAGAPRVFGDADTQVIVRNSLPRLNRELQRTLVNVRGSGYRVAWGNEHLSLALRHESKADRQLKRGLTLLKNVRRDEMSANELRQHDGMLLVLGAIHGQQQQLVRRQNEVERTLAEVQQQIQRLAQ